MTYHISEISSGKQGAIDPISLEIYWSRLIAVANEAAATLVRTSFSPIVRETNDFACALFDAEGNAIADNTIGVPAFNMTLSHTLRHFLKRRPLKMWRAGDVGITNDPWLVAGHLPDVAVLAPIFLEDRLVAWSGSIAHQVDIGGIGWSADARSVYEEGLRIPPSLLFREGNPNEDLFDVIRSNVRLADQVVGDLLAMVNASHTARTRLLQLMSDTRIDDLSAISYEIRTRAEKSMRTAISAIPDGTYCSTLDLDGTPEEPIHIQLAVTVSGDEMTVDYTGTSPQVNSGLNAVMNYTEAYTCLPLKCLLDPSIPRNEGSFKPIRVIAPEGCILNTRFPSAVNARVLVVQPLSGMLFDALSVAIPERITGESGSAPVLRVVISGIDKNGRSFNSLLFMNGGMGARPNADGLSTTSFPSTVTSGSMEVLETTGQLRVWSKEFVVDSGGPGRFRGGLGQSVELEILPVSSSALSLFVERTKFPPRGVLGGKGSFASIVEVNGNRNGFPLKGRSRLSTGDRIRVWYPGGGGYGDPTHRDRNAVCADVEAGVVSRKAAWEIYEWN